MTPPSKKVFIKTYGCQMNVYDSQRMDDVLSKEGYSATTTLDDADLVILNTCHIREKAVEKVYSGIGRLRKMKEERAQHGRALTIGVAGCVAQAEGAEIVRRAPAVDLVFGPQTYHLLPSLLEKVAKGEKAIETEFPVEDKFDHLPPSSTDGIAARGTTAFLTVQEGCDKFCTFCVVPYTRGTEVSRPVAQILADAQRLVAAGVREITLLGQNVNGYHGLDAQGQVWSLGRLLTALNDIDGLERLRYTTSHPRDMHEELYEAHGTLSKLMPYLHLPLQSGSDRILAAMNRKHTVAEYMAIIERMKQVQPGLALSSDFIVGFPGETEEDFEATLDVVRRVGYAACYSFKYSPRPGTPAASMENHVPESVKDERLQRLQSLLDQNTKAFADTLIGTSMDILLEKPGRLEGQMVGRSPYLQPVQVMLPVSMRGLVVRVRITHTGTYSLFGVLESEDEAAVGQQ